MTMKPHLTKTIALLALLLTAASAHAHFPWLAIDPDGRVLHFFGEDPGERTYGMPPSVAKAKIQLLAGDAEAREIEMEAVESDQFSGRRSSEAVGAGTALRSQVTYGVRKDSRLDYYTLHLMGPLPKSREAYRNEPAPELSAQLVDTESGVDVYVLLKGKPLADAKVRLYNERGDDGGAATTDGEGRVSFTDEQVEAGLNGIVVGRTENGEKGEIDGKPYEAVSRYLTATFADPEGSADDGKAKAEATSENTSEAAPSAKALRLAAHGSRAVWDDFPGFTADIAISVDTETHTGKIVVAGDFEYELKIDEAAQQPWVAAQLRSVISHRKPSEAGDYNVSFPEEDAQHIAGRLVLDNDGGGALRIQDGVIREVHRKTDSAWFEVSTLDTQKTDDGRYLPKVSSVTYRDPKTGDLQSTRSNTFSWKKVGAFHLPKETLTVELGPDGKRATRRIAFSNHKLAEATAGTKTNSKLHSPLREPLTSFGAAIVGEHLYVFSGHDGAAEAFGADALADHFRRIKFDDSDAEWEELAKHDPAQSTALVTDGTHLYRIGGLTFLNRGDEETNFKSTTHFARYDIEKNEWTDLAPLPEPRSSLDAAVLDRSIYVAGGWNLQGASSRDAHWYENILRFDLDKPEAGWQSLDGPGYVSRAISLAAHDGKIYMIGGIGKEGVTRKVSVFDPADGSWSEGPELKPDSRSAGFATSSFATGGKLYVTGGSGVLYRLSGDAKDWEIADSLIYPRMFLRLLPASETRLVALGGTSSIGGRMAIVESIDVSAKPQAFKTVRWSVQFDGRAKQSQVLVPHGSKLYAFGGNASRSPHDFTEEMFLNEAFAFDIANRTFEKLPDVPRTLQSGGGVAYSQTSEHSKIILAGGLGMKGDQFGAIQDILTFDPEAKKWTSSPVSLPEPRSMFRAATHDDALWFFGGAGAGEDGRGLTTSVLHWWGDESEVAALPKVDVPTPRRSFGGATLKDEYYLVGGLVKGSDPAESVDVFHFEDRSWRQAAAPKVPRIFPSLAEANGKLYLFGGFTKADDHFTPAPSLEVYDPAKDEWTTLAEKLDNIPPSMNMVAFGGRLLFYGVDPETDGKANFVLAVPESTASPGTFERESFSQRRRRGEGGDSTESAKTLMRRDADKDGKLTAEELGSRLASLLEEGDANGDGVLTYREAKAALEKRERSKEAAARD